MLSCAIYILEGASEGTKMQAMQFFIFSFMAMMGIIIMQLLFGVGQFLVGKVKSKCNKNKQKKTMVEDEV
jgi:hypothetical protein